MAENGRDGAPMDAGSMTTIAFSERDLARGVTRLDVNFQEVVHSVPAGNADVAKP
jgi:hypothetical protein